MNRRASYLNPGDIILYGKYKNHRGKIVSFGSDKWGNPTVEIEPIPKGRKQNKVMGLFKIWRADVKETQSKNLVAKVATRFIVTRLGLGEMAEQGDIRVHRYSNMLVIWDLTNAGKRGKNVTRMTAMPTSRFKGNLNEWLDGTSTAIEHYTKYSQVKSFFKDLQHDFPGEIDVSESTERGVDVNPGGTRIIQFETNTGLRVTAEPKDFIVTHSWELRSKEGKPTGMTQDTSYWPAGKKDAKVFYNWLAANEAEARRMTIQDMRKMWKDLKVQYDSH